VTRVEDAAADREAREVAYWESSPLEGSGADTVGNLVNKLRESSVFLEKAERFAAVFATAADHHGTVVELAGGECWGACIVARLHPKAAVIGSDLAPAAVASTTRWEAVFASTLAGKTSSRSSALPYRGGRVDVLFVFAAAHHFARHRETLIEIARVLRPGGTALYLHEPACRSFFYRLAKWRVNRKRPEVPEDLIVPARLIEDARAAGLDIDLRPAPTAHGRAPVAGMYYLVLTRLPWLCRLLPCTVDVVLRKPPAGA
jgi:SAM-dependent methyltransferase